MKRRKLSLHKETVRLLVEPELRGAVGLATSGTETTPYHTCYPCGSLRYCTACCVYQTEVNCSLQQPCRL